MLLQVLCQGDLERVVDERLDGGLEAQRVRLAGVMLKGCPIAPVGMNVEFVSVPNRLIGVVTQAAWLIARSALNIVNGLPDCALVTEACMKSSKKD